MNGEVERPQRGGDFAGAQGPHRVPSAKAVRKKEMESRQCRERAVYFAEGANLNFFLTISRASCSTWFTRSHSPSSSSPPPFRQLCRRRCVRLSCHAADHAADMRLVTSPVLSLPYRSYWFSHSLARDAPLPLTTLSETLSLRQTLGSVDFFFFKAT